MRQLPKSQTDRIDGFEVHVARHAADMKVWRAHMGRVADDERNGVTGIEKHQQYNRPVAHPMVEAAVNENDDADYQIVDDGPSAAEILTAKKSTLLDGVAAAEQTAIDTIVPAGKRRLFDMREADIRKADGILANDLISKRKPGVLASITSAVGLTKQMDTSDIAAHVEEVRPDGDTKHLEEQQARREAIERIRRIAAQAQHDIEDLTAETVDSFKIPVFPT